VRGKQLIYSLLLVLSVGWACYASRDRSPRRSQDSLAAPAPRRASDPQELRTLIARSAQAPEPQADEEGDEPELTCMTGKVVDSQTGRPIPGASVSLRVGEDLLVIEEVDEEGRFELGCSASEFERASKGARLEADDDDHAQAAAAIPPGGLGGEAVIRMERLGTVAGIVVDERGVPVVGVSIYLAGDAGYVVETDPQGRFAAAAIAPGEQIVYCWDSDREEEDPPRLAAERVRLRPGETRQVRLVLRPATVYRLRGRVVDLAGRALEGIVIKARTDAPTPASRALTDSASEVTTGEKGEFEIEVATAEAHTIELRHQVGGALILATRLLAAKDPRVATLVVRERAIQCSLLDASGRAVSLSSISAAVIKRGEEGEEEESGSITVDGPASFLWPPGAVAIEVTLWAPGVEGRTRLTRPDQPCVARSSKATLPALFKDPMNWPAP